MNGSGCAIHGRFHCDRNYVPIAWEFHCKRNCSPGSFAYSEITKPKKLHAEQKKFPFAKSAGRPKSGRELRRLWIKPEAYDALEAEAKAVGFSGIGAWLENILDTQGKEAPRQPPGAPEIEKKR